MASTAHGEEGAVARHSAIPPPGTTVGVRMCRGRLATRPGHVLDVRAFDGAVQGVLIGVRWDDDGSVAWLVPGTDVEVTTVLSVNS